MAALCIHNKIRTDPLYVSVVPPRPAIFTGFGVKPCKAPQRQPGLRRRILRSIGNCIFTVNIKEFPSCAAVQACLAKLACFAVTLSPWWTRLYFSPSWGSKRTTQSARSFLRLPFPLCWLQWCQCPAVSLVLLVFCFISAFQVGLPFLLFKQVGIRTLVEHLRGVCQ